MVLYILIFRFSDNIRQYDYEDHLLQIILTD